MSAPPVSPPGPSNKMLAQFAALSHCCLRAVRVYRSTIANRGTAPHRLFTSNPGGSRGYSQTNPRRFRTHRHARAQPKNGHGRLRYLGVLHCNHRNLFAALPRLTRRLAAHLQPVRFPHRHRLVTQATGLSAPPRHPPSRATPRRSARRHHTKLYHRAVAIARSPLRAARLMPSLHCARSVLSLGCIPPPHPHQGPAFVDSLTAKAPSATSSAALPRRAEPPPAPVACALALHTRRNEASPSTSAYALRAATFSDGVSKLNAVFSRRSPAAAAGALTADSLKRHPAKRHMQLPSWSLRVVASLPPIARFTDTSRSHIALIPFAQEDHGLASLRPVTFSPARRSGKSVWRKAPSPLDHGSPPFACCRFAPSPQPGRRFRADSELHHRADAIGTHASLRPGLMAVATAPPPLRQLAPVARLQPAAAPSWGMLLIRRRVGA